jgi:hypothetical protein
MGQQGVLLLDDVKENIDLSFAFQDPLGDGHDLLGDCHVPRSFGNACACYRSPLISPRWKRFDEVSFFRHSPFIPDAISVPKKDSSASIGSFQEAMEMGRTNVAIAIMTFLSRRHACPRRKHIDCKKSIVVYPYRSKFAKAQRRTHDPGSSALMVLDHYWSRTIYSNGTGNYDDQSDAAKPLSKFLVVTTAHVVDTSLLHDLVMGRSITGILHLGSRLLIMPFCSLCKKH